MNNAHTSTNALHGLTAEKVDVIFPDDTIEAAFVATFVCEIDDADLPEIKPCLNIRRAEFSRVKQQAKFLVNMGVGLKVSAKRVHGRALYRVPADFDGIYKGADIGSKLELVGTIIQTENGLTVQPQSRTEQLN